MLPHVFARRTRVWCHNLVDEEFTSLLTDKDNARIISQQLKVGCLSVAFAAVLTSLRAD